LVTAFAGGLLVLGSHAYFLLTGLLLIAAATLMMLKRAADTVRARPVGLVPAAFAGAGAGFLSGLTGVGGGVFLTPLLIALGWATPRQAAALSPPFILCNSVVGLAGVSLAGQTLAPGTLVFSGAALLGAVIGTGIGLRWMSERITRYVLAAILLFAGLRLLLRQAAAQPRSGPMNDAGRIPIDTRVMAPLRDVLHRGLVVAPAADQPLEDGMIYIAFTPPVTMVEPYSSIDFIICPISRVTLGWF
jgi:hypothetical protein